jgi:heptosyltransferase-1
VAKQASDSEFMRVLIIKTAPLADIVHALPVLDFLHTAAPGIEIDWVVEERFADMLSGNPLIRHLFTIDLEKWRKKLFSPSTWKEVLTVKTSLAAGCYTIVFDLQGELTSGLIAKYTGCSRRYGFDADEVKEAANLRFTTNQVPLRKQDHHAADRCLRVVSVPFGKDYTGMKLSVDVAISPEDDQAAELFLATLLDGLVFMFHPATALETMQWSEKGWIELGKELTEFYPDATVVISWSGERERVSAENIARGVGRHVKLLQQSSIQGFAAVLRKVDIFFGGDAAPVHIAAAVGTPTVSFYRATDGKLSGPRGDNHRIVQSQLSCAHCLRQTCEKDADCRESIKVAAMLAAAAELLEPGSSFQM